MRVAIYARVSTSEQDDAMQHREMSEMCVARKWDPTVFADPGYSGAKERRPALDAMMAACRRGKFDVVLVYKFDRFARSLRHLLNALAEFDALGIQFVSVHDAIDTSLPNGRLMFQIIGAFAEFERSILQQRIRSGIANARANGKVLGRPRRGVDLAKLRLLRAQGFQVRDIARMLGISVGTAHRALKGLFQKPLKPG